MDGNPLSDVVVARLIKEMDGYAELGLQEEVIERANRLLLAGQERIWALTYKGRSLQELERFADAIPVFEELRDRDEKADTAYFGLGWCYKRTGRLDLAIAALRDLLIHQPEHPLGLYNLACYLALDGQRDEPLSLLRRAVALDDDYLEHARTETDLDALRDDEDFQAILAR
jgi:tetratricopeptide (TPR) repeat protein